MSWKRPRPKSIYLALAILPVIVLTLFFQNCGGPFGASSSWILFSFGGSAKDIKTNSRMSGKENTTIDVNAIIQADEEYRNTHQELQKMEILKRPEDIRELNPAKEVIETETADQPNNDPVIIPTNIPSNFADDLPISESGRKPTNQVPKKAIKTEKPAEILEELEEAEKY